MAASSSPVRALVAAACVLFTLSLRAEAQTEPAFATPPADVDVDSALTPARSRAADVAGAVAAPAPRPLNATRLHLPPGLGQIRVRQAVEGAALRLAAPRCQQVLREFSDGHGRLLLENLNRLNTTAPDYLTQLWFVDASKTTRCQGHGREAAFTQVGSRVIHVCGSRFASADFRLQGGSGDIVIIHEMLHSLGLGENPPTTAAITAQVALRCGDDALRAASRVEPAR